MADPNYFYKVTKLCTDGSEIVLYADTNIYQARHAYHSHDPCTEFTEIRWYGIDISSLPEPQPGTMPSTPQVTKTLPT